MTLNFGKNRELKTFPVQIQWEFVSAVPFQVPQWGKRFG